MTFTTSIIFYLTFGGCVAVAVYLNDTVSMSDSLYDTGRSGAERIFRVLSAVFFWPLYLPLLIERGRRASVNDAIEPEVKRDMDSLAQAIVQVETELDAALRGLDGWAEGVLADEHPRLNELRLAWRSQADRIRELDRLLAVPELAVSDGADRIGDRSDEALLDRRVQSGLARAENIRRLQEMRARMSDDLMGTLAWVRELVTMIHLARFSGAPASRAEELVSQIAAAVEGLREASAWRETDPAVS